MFNRGINIAPHILSLMGNASNMEDLQNNIIISDTLSGIGTETYNGYLGHALCLDGSCHIVFNGNEFEMKRGDLMIVRQGKLIQSVKADSGFRVMIIYIAAPFIELCTPQSNYGMKGQLALFLNPIMHLAEEQFEQCLRNFENLRARMAQTDHHFYQDMMKNKVQSLIIDFFDFHATLYQEKDVSTHFANIMSRFLSLLESGELRRHREVTWYADKLCVSPKYLSEVSKSVSGYAANFWINRYTVLDISRLLRDKSLSFAQISDMFGFSSLAYFSRYVSRNLGMRPTDCRND